MVFCCPVDSSAGPSGRTAGWMVGSRWWGGVNWLVVKSLTLNDTCNALHWEFSKLGPAGQTAAGTVGLLFIFFGRDRSRFGRSLVIDCILLNFLLLLFVYISGQRHKLGVLYYEDVYDEPSIYLLGIFGFSSQGISHFQWPQFYDAVGSLEGFSNTVAGRTIYLALDNLNFELVGSFSVV